MSPVKEVSSIFKEDSSNASISSTFFPGFRESSTDIVFRSTDLILFHVHSHILLDVSKDAFGGFLSNPLAVEPQFGTIDIPESSAILDVILHMIYDISSADHSPTYNILEEAVDKMPRYGVIPKLHIKPLTPLYNLLLLNAPLIAIRLYALAGRHDLYYLAFDTSSYLLAFDLSTITDSMSQRMGPIYLKRLMALQLGRLDKLKQILLQPPRPHPPTDACDFSEQKRLARAWVLLASILAWDAKPDLSVHTIQTMFDAMLDHLICESCRVEFESRVEDVVVKWATTKRTI